MPEITSFVLPSTIVKLHLHIVLEIEINMFPRHFSFLQTFSLLDRSQLLYIVCSVFGAPKLTEINQTFTPAFLLLSSIKRQILSRLVLIRIESKLLSARRMFLNRLGTMSLSHRFRQSSIPMYLTLQFSLYRCKVIYWSNLHQNLCSSVRSKMILLFSRHTFASCEGLLSALFKIQI